MNPEFQLARFLLNGATVLIGVATLVLWCYALAKTKLWFLSLLALSALMSVGFGLISLAMLWDARAWMAMLGRSGFITFYNVLLFGQVIECLIDLAGVALLVVWLCRAHPIVSYAKTQPASAANAG